MDTAGRAYLTILADAHISLRSALDPQSAATRRIADLWWVMLGLGTFVALFVAVALVVGVRRDPAAESPGGRGDDHEGTSRRWIIGAGVIGPAVIIAIVLVATVWSMRAESRDAASSDALRIDVTGHQWWWEVRYHDSAIITANEVHLPVGVNVEIHLRSADVIHSFWVPALAGKLDALPDRTNTITIAADTPGRYAARCAEFCGLQHANMDFVVVAHTADDFDAWIDATSTPAASPVTALQERGEELFTANGCGSCHRVAGVSKGPDHPAPDLTHLASRDAIAGGLLDPTVPDLSTWIADPHAVKPGAKMPAIELSDDDLGSIVAYLESLE